MPYNLKPRITDGKFYFKLSTVLISSVLLLTSCEKFVEVEAPVTSTNGINVYTTDATAIAVLTGIHINLSQGTGVNFATGGNSLSLVYGLSADELKLYAGASSDGIGSYYNNTLSALGIQNFGPNYWAPLFNYVFKCNAAIEGIEKSSGLTPAVQRQLLGESKFLRAFFLFLPGKYFWRCTSDN